MSGRDQFLEQLTDLLSSFCGEGTRCLHPEDHAEQAEAVLRGIEAQPGPGFAFMVELGLSDRPQA